MRLSPWFVPTLILALAPTLALARFVPLFCPIVFKIAFPLPGEWRRIPV